MAVLATVRECESRGIAEACRSAMHHFRDERERLQSPRAELLQQQERGKVAEVTLVREREDGAQPLLVHVGGAHVVVRRHFEMTDLRNDAQWILAGDRQERLLGRPCLSIDEVHDRTGMLADDGRMRLGGEVAY